MALPLLFALAWLAAGPASGQPAPAPATPTTPATPAPATPAAPPSAEDAIAEGAALKVGAAARQLAETAEAIARDGKIGRLSVLRADADELARRADLLVRATAPVDEGAPDAREDAAVRAGDAPPPR